MADMNSLMIGAFLVLIHAAPASAETRQFANIVYEIPEGWESSGKSDGRMELQYRAERRGCERCRILLDVGVAGGGPIEQWLDRMSAPGEDVRIVKARTQRETMGGRPVAVTLRQVDDDGRSLFQAFFAIDLPERNELVVFEGSARDRETFDRTLATLNADVAPMLETITFISEGAEPVLGAPEAGDLEGPWFGTAIRNRFNGLSGTLELVVDREAITFYRNGRFHKGVPQSGSRPIDADALIAAGEIGFGNYVVSGDEIELRFVDGNVSRLRMVGDTAIDAGRVTLHLTPFAPDGFRFAGTIRSVKYSAFGPGISGGVGSESAQVFRKNGTYTDSSFTGAFGSFDTGGGFTTTTGTSDRVGHYEVDDGLITMTPPDGKPRTTWIALEGSGNVIIGGQPVVDASGQ